MDLSVLESQVYNYSINVIGFMMTLKKANLNNAITSEIVKNAGTLNTCLIDALELKKEEIKIQLGKCIHALNTLQSLFTKLDLEPTYDNNKTNLQIETAEILKAMKQVIT
ncbi:MAG: hypothetical protein GXO79_10625 [Chlorobi bacterium]|nr:hypothetical protein [Chlorobiota bacterium]